MNDDVTKLLSRSASALQQQSAPTMLNPNSPALAKLQQMGPRLQAVRALSMPTSLPGMLSPMSAAVPGMLGGLSAAPFRSDPMQMELLRKLDTLPEKIAQAISRSQPGQQKDSPAKQKEAPSKLDATIGLFRSLGKAIPGATTAANVLKWGKGVSSSWKNFRNAWSDQPQPKIQPLPEQAQQTGLPTPPSQTPATALPTAQVVQNPAIGPAFLPSAIPVDGSSQQPGAAAQTAPQSRIRSLPGALFSQPRPMPAATGIFPSAPIPNGESKLIGVLEKLTTEISALCEEIGEMRGKDGKTQASDNSSKDDKDKQSSQNRGSSPFATQNHERSQENNVDSTASFRRAIGSVLGTAAQVAAVL